MFENIATLNKEQKSKRTVLEWTTVEKTLGLFINAFTGEMILRSLKAEIV